MEAKNYLKISDTPETLFKAIPKIPAENIAFRKELHEFLFSDEKAKTDFLAKCFYDPRIFFSSTLWTFNAQAEHGYKHIPFILWPHQEIAVQRIKNAIESRKDLLFDKSRKQGATYIILGVFLLYWLVSSGSRFLIGSRKEELVDDGSEIVENIVAGSEESLFYKLLYMINTLPIYLQPKFFKKHCFLQNLEMDTSFKGETTNIGFGKGFRTTANLVDEAAQIEPKLGRWIIENLADTAFCSIFNSTVGPWGEAHPYSKLLKEHKDRVITLDWLDNPTMNYGKYISRKEGYIEIADIDYFRKHYPGKFDNIQPYTSVNVDEVRNSYAFTADAGVSNWGCWRTVWFDEEEKRPSRTKRGIAQNILRLNTGSVDSFFEYDLITKLRESIKEPSCYGDINYNRNEFNEIENVGFGFGGRDSPLCWWSELQNRRPNQRHNYTVGCDISKGTGTSNSVAAIYDVNTNEICGIYVNPYLKISDFAEKVIAICHWVGGARAPLLVWETNNASEFLDRVRELGYYNLYVNRDKRLRKTKLSNTYGWRSTGGIDGSKRAVLNELSAALYESQSSNPRFSPCKVYDEQLINELESYVNYEGRIDVGPVSLQTETSGAKAAHGDRVIAVALAVLGAKSQVQANEDYRPFIPDGSFAARMERIEKKAAAERAEGKIWFY